MNAISSCNDSGIKIRESKGKVMRNIIDYQEKYFEEPFEDIQVCYRRKKVIELLKRYTHNNILEIGCGLEPLYKEFDDYDKLVIVEPAPAFFEAIESKNNIICIKGFFEEVVNQILELEIRFDYIIVGSLLHEVDDPQKLLNAIKCVCNKDTVVHINVPNAYSMHRLLAREMGIIADVYERSELQKTMQRRCVYDLDGLKTEVIQAGFRVVDSGGVFIKFFTHSQMQRMLDEKIIDMAILDGMYALGEAFPDNCSEIYVQVMI